MKNRRTTIVLAIATGLTFGLFASPGFTEEGLPPYPFNADGTVKRPQDYRQWVHVGSTVLPKGRVNIIDKKPIPTAENMDIYVQPKAYEIYMKTGVWPDGAAIAKEFVAVKEPDSSGVLHEDYYTGLTLIIKDSSRFPKETAHLGFFQFGHQREPYAETATVMPRAACSSCHEEKASHQQNLFSDHHIGLRRSQ